MPLQDKYWNGRYILKVQVNLSFSIHNKQFIDAGICIALYSIVIAFGQLTLYTNCFLTTTLKRCIKDVM